MDSFYLGQIIKKCRTHAGLSQQELADYLGVSFATVNRWENNHAQPTQVAQNRLGEFCQEHDVPVMDFIRERMASFVETIDASEDQLVLYHGSRGGIDGSIMPVSRKYCDFGPGFYMGTMPEQPLTLVCDIPDSKFYILSLRTKGLSLVDIAPDLDWAMVVAYHRGKMDGIVGSALYDKYSRFTEGADIVVGSIADDRMFQVLDDFFLSNITDVALTRSLSALQLGRQYVALTEKACDAITVVAELEISHFERAFLQQLGAENRKRGVALAEEVYRANRREGKYFDEILEENLEGQLVENSEIQKSVRKASRR